MYYLRQQKSPPIWAKRLSHIYTFFASASEVLFDGFLKVMAINIHKKKEEDEDEEVEEVDHLPPLATGDVLQVLQWLSDRKETKPPSRFSEASLIRALEANGVGRPSTYAAIIETLNSREYTTREKRQLAPTELGLKVNDLLVAKLEALFNVNFTAEMEEELDHVEEGRTEWTQMMENFYKRFTTWMELAKEPPVDMAKVTGVMALVSQIKEWAPEVQRGKRKYSDERFVASIVEQLETKEKPVSEKQVEALVKIGLRYRSQIPDLEAQLATLGYEQLVVSDNAMATTESSMTRFQVLEQVELSESQAGFVASLRSQVVNGRKLSDKQVAALERIIVQNASQFANFDAVREQLGLSAEQSKTEVDTESPVLLEMLGQVTTWQEPVTRGKMVFNDKDFYDSLAGQYARQQSLTFRQRGAMKRMVFRYKGQIPQFDTYAAQLGLNKKAEKKDE